jgi:hypothetical protein
MNSRADGTQNINGSNINKVQPEQSNVVNLSNINSSIADSGKSFNSIHAQGLTFGNSTSGTRGVGGNAHYIN